MCRNHEKWGVFSRQYYCTFFYVKKKLKKNVNVKRKKGLQRHAYIWGNKISTIWLCLEA